MDVKLKAQRWKRRRGRSRRRVVAITALLLVLCLVIAMVVLRPRPHHVLAAVAPQAAQRYRQTAWLRAGAPWTGSELSQVRAAIGALVSDQVFPDTTGILVMDPRSGTVLYSHNATLPLVPGSTIKLLTASAALRALGPDHRFTTEIVSNTSTDGGRLNGNIWLVGGGDPELSSDDLRRGVHELQLGGVQDIGGNVVADGSRYGRDQVAASWLADDLQYGWAAPASALSIDGGSIQFTITPRAGSQADVSVDPPGQQVIASVATVSSDADNTLQIDALPDGYGFEVSGQIPYGAPQKYWRAVAHPTRNAAIALLAMLRSADVSVGGSASVGKAPSDATVLWRHQSRTLDQIIKQMFFLSDNHYAEELLRAVGWNATGLGDIDSSLAAERAFMRTAGIPTTGIVLADGSGLSQQNRLTANALAAALVYLLDQRLPEPAFTLLPRAGLEGTVSVRHLAPATLGRVFAKDGYIDGASSIAGYVLTAHHGPVIFAFLVNNWQYGLDSVWADEDATLDLLARQ